MSNKRRGGRYAPSHALAGHTVDLHFCEDQLANWLRGVPVTLADIEQFERPARRILAALEAERARLLSAREG